MHYASVIDCCAIKSFIDLQEFTSLAGYYPVDESCSQATLHFWEELIVSDCVHHSLVMSILYVRT